MKHFKTIYEEYLTEGVYDPGIFKAFFLAGGPGSGKTFVTQSAFGGTGLKVVNPDAAFEKNLIMTNLSLQMPPQEEYFRHLMRMRAKATTNTILGLYVQVRLGLVIDATGRDLPLVQRQYNMLKNLGYDCYMIFVNTSLEVAQQRNKARSRSVPEYIVTNSWRTVQANIGSFQKIFKPQNMLILDNNRSEEELITITLNQAARFIRSRLRTPPDNLIAKTWIAKELEIKKRV